MSCKMVLLCFPCGFSIECMVIMRFVTYKEGRTCTYKLTEEYTFISFNRINMFCILNQIARAFGLGQFET